MNVGERDARTTSVDRTTLWPFDLSTANENWLHGYKLPRGDHFHFGGRAYSITENVGYFLNSREEIVAFRKNGSQTGRWTSFHDMLEEELIASEALGGRAT
jgi:hypothetical protein